MPRPRALRLVCPVGRYQTNLRFNRREALQILYRAVEVSLHRQATIAEFALDGLENVQSGVRVSAGFHVHFNGAPERGGPGGNVARHPAAKLFVDVQAELRQLDGDVSGEVFGKR